MRDWLRSIASEAIAACRGDVLTAAALRRDPRLLAGPCHLLALGKAACSMARGALQVLHEHGVSVRGGMLVTKAGHDCELPPLRSFIGGHPEPSAASAAAGRALLNDLAAIPPDEHVLALVSGGTSALIATPRRGVSVAELAAASRTLLASGVDITRMNAQRGKLSAVAAGGLARACRAPIEVLLLSDVLGDDPATIGSGPFYLPPSQHAAGQVRHSFAGSHATLLDAAAAAVASIPVPATSAIPTSAATKSPHPIRLQRVAAVQDDVVAVAQRWATHLREAPPGTLFIGGGEPTVVLPEQPGRGGRNQHLALLMAGVLRQAGRPCAFAAVGSDGDDGNSSAAGAVVDERSWQHMEQRAQDPRQAIRAANSHPVLSAIDACLHTGPTGTNLLDLHLLWVGAPYDSGATSGSLDPGASLRG